MEDLPAVAHHASEFLAWLWWMTETNGSEISFDEEGEQSSINSIGSCEVWIDSRLTFRNADDYRPNTVLTGENPSERPEARTALSTGKMMQEMRLGIRVDDEREFLVTLQGPALEIKGAKLPQVISDGDEAILDRIYLLEIMDKVIADLFGMFCRQRTSEDWGHTILPKIQSWAARGDEE